MSSVDRVAANVSTAVSKSDDTDAAIGSASAMVDELTSGLRAAGIEDRAAMSDEVRSVLDEAAAQQVGARQSLEQALAIINGLKGSGSGPSGNTPAPLKQTDMVSGESLLERAKSSGSRFGRFTRDLAENAEDVGNLARQTTDTGFKIMKSHNPDPPAGAVHTGSQVPEPIVDQAPSQHATVGDFLATGVMLGAVTTTFIRNMRNRRQERKHDGF